MPTYTFKDKTTNELVEHVMKMSEYDQFVQENPNLERTFEDSPGLVSGVAIGTSMKPSSGFRELLKGIKKKHRRSTINDF
jgi:hypothetical protein